MKREIKENNFEKIDYTSIDDAKCIESNDKIIKLWSRRIELEEVYHEEKSRDKYEAKSFVTFKDEEDNKIYSTEIDKKMYLQLREYKKKGKPVEVLAKVMKEKEKDYYYNILKIIKYKAGNLPLQQLQVSSNELILVKKFLAKISIQFKKTNKWGLLDEIKAAVVEDLNIVGTDVDDPYNDAIDAMICQAFSGGTVRNTNAKINTCIIGPPAGGKKLLWEIAKMINVVSREAQAIRVTQAGLTANMANDYKLGAIPLANKGVFGLQDFDKCQTKAELLSIFSDVMEDGKCIINGVHKAELEAETAIHIDMNRLSDLYLNGSTLKNVTEDISLPTNIISRFDFIVEFNKDFELQNRKINQLLIGGLDLKKRGDSKIALYCMENGIKFERFIKLVVAYVMTEFQDINMEPVQKHMSDGFLKIMKVNKENIEKVPEIAMFSMRLMYSAIKFVHAFTRLQLLEKSNREAVDKAFHLLSRKLDFLKNINRDFLVPHYRTMGKEAFVKWLYDNYQDTRFAPKQLYKDYKKAKSPCGEVSFRTFYYWIQAFAEKKKQGSWKIKDIFREKFSKDD
ncbi:MAG: hypothetical protein K8R68_02820 [Bacteroidales bacterium]|nr:hypothetical protein [Bacteroidales bacterium]